MALIASTSRAPPAASKRSRCAGRVSAGSSQASRNADSASGARNQNTAGQSISGTSSPAISGPSAPPMPITMV